MNPVISKKTFQFLDALDTNNNRDWFNEHKPEFKAIEFEVKLFYNELGQLMNTHDHIDKVKVFRIYRDVRFSKNKLPYKTHFGCWMARGGRKSTDAGYYFHLEPGNTFMAAGVWMPPKDQLHLIRQEILYQPDPYLKLIRTPRMKAHYQRGGKEDMLKKGPLGFPKDFAHMDELKYKHYVWSRAYSDSEAQQKGFAGKVVDDCEGLFPVVSYLNHAMSFSGNQ